MYISYRFMDKTAFGDALTMGSNLEQHERWRTDIGTGTPRRSGMRWAEWCLRRVLGAPLMPSGTVA